MPGRGTDKNQASVCLQQSSLSFHHSLSSEQEVPNGGFYFNLGHTICLVSDSSAPAPATPQGAVRIWRWERDGEQTTAVRVLAGRREARQV